jgi:hypothetical protein
MWLHILFCCVIFAGIKIWHLLAKEELLRQTKNSETAPIYAE